MFLYDLFVIKVDNGTLHDILYIEIIKYTQGHTKCICYATVVEKYSDHMAKSDLMINIEVGQTIEKCYNFGLVVTSLIIHVNTSSRQKEEPQIESNAARDDVFQRTVWRKSVTKRKFIFNIYKRR